MNDFFVGWNNRRQHAAQLRPRGIALAADKVILMLNWYVYSEHAPFYYGKEKVVKDNGPSPLDSKYISDGYNKFLDKDGYPAIQPPWGTLTAIDLNSGKTAWKIPLGEYPELAAQGLTNTGSENYGGPVVTAGGLLFICAKEPP